MSILYSNQHESNQETRLPAYKAIAGLMLCLLCAPSYVFAGPVINTAVAGSAKFVRVETSASLPADISDKALTDGALAKVHGRSAETAIKLQDRKKTAVILWDEIKNGNNRTSLSRDQGGNNRQNNTIEMLGGGK